MRFIITFGQVHVHRVNNQTFNKDCVAVIVADEKFMSYFPRGKIMASRRAPDGTVGRFHWLGCEGCHYCDRNGVCTTTPDFEPSDDLVLVVCSRRRPKEETED